MEAKKLLSPNPVGRPDTQAISNTDRFFQVVKVEFEVLQPTQVVQVVRKGFVSRQWNVSYFQLVPLQPRLKLLDLNLTLLLEHPRGEVGYAL